MFPLLLFSFHQQRVANASAKLPLTRVCVSAQKHELFQITGNVLSTSSTNINRTFMHSYLVFNRVLKTLAQTHCSFVYGSHNREFLNIQKYVFITKMESIREMFLYVCQ